MTIVHLTASRFFGGPERQMLELARALPSPMRTVFTSFQEGGGCHEFLGQVRRHGFEGIALRHDTPRLFSARNELVELLQEQSASILLTHGYKADLLGYFAARRAGIPIVSVSRGWTGENFRVRVYEALDRRILRRMDRVVCVSAGQAARVRRCGVPAEKVVVIHNAIRTERFELASPGPRASLQALFSSPCQWIVGAAGRLSPEKGFDVLVDAAAAITRREPAVGFVLYGEGVLRASLTRRIEAAGLNGRFLLPGFRKDLDRVLPSLDLLVLPSHTEGLPNVVLESLAAGVPVVATAVGGTPEVLDDGISGYLVPPGDAGALAERIGDLLGSEDRRRAMGRDGQERVQRDFTFAAQAVQYQRLFAELLGNPAESTNERRLLTKAR